MRMPASSGIVMVFVPVISPAIDIYSSLVSEKEFSVKSAFSPDSMDPIGDLPTIRR